MNTATLTNKINALPAGLQKQVADFVEFLLLKYRIQSDEESALTPEQKKELLALWEDYEKKTGRRVEHRNAPGTNQCKIWPITSSSFKAAGSKYRKVLLSATLHLGGTLRKANLSKFP